MVAASGVVSAVRALPALQASSCAVCGSGEIHVDHARHHGWVELGECKHCGHRWTAPVRALPRGRSEPRTTPSGRGMKEVADAA